MSAATASAAAGATGGVLVARLLGPLELAVGSTPVVVAGPRQRALLAQLALRAGEVVSVAGLLDAVWGDPVPDRAERTLQQHISTVRKQLATQGAPDALQTQRPGYRLMVGRLDVHDWDAAAREGFDATRAQRWDRAVDAFDTALRCWRGAALADVQDTEALRAAAVALEEQRLAVHEGRCDALLACGRHREATAVLEHLVVTHPLRERLWALLMVALYRGGRQADALSAYRHARTTLLEELGIEPGAELRELETAILQQRPSLDRAEPTPAVEPAEIFATYKAGALPDLGSVVLPDGQSVALPPGTTTIGRDPEALVRLVDNRVSRRHATIEATTAGCILRDVGSSNGTTVNDVDVVEHHLRDGDVLSLGGVRLVFRHPPGDASPRTS